MKESRQQAIPIQQPFSTTDEVFNKTMSGDFMAKYNKARGEFEAEHPELFPDDRHMPARERRDILTKRNELWREKLGIVDPQVPSLQDGSREAACIKCRDGGWVQPISTDKDGNRVYGATVPCPNCNAQEDEKARRRLAYAGIPDTQSMATFETFKRVKGTEDAFDSVKALVYGARYFMVLLMGPYGNGKTHLAYAAVREAAKQGMKARFLYFPDMLGQIRLKIDRKDDSQGFIEEIKAVQFLALDEIGFEHNTPWAAGLLEEIVNHRYAERLHTILTTNRDVKTLPLPLQSRFLDRDVARICLNSAKDFRPSRRIKGEETR